MDDGAINSLEFSVKCVPSGVTKYNFVSCGAMHSCCAPKTILRLFADQFLIKLLCSLHGFYTNLP